MGKWDPNSKCVDMPQKSRTPRQHTTKHFSAVSFRSFHQSSIQQLASIASTCHACAKPIFRVYDNARANAVMQKAITILSHEENLSRGRREKFRAFIHGECAPEREFYDDDSTAVGGEDLQKVTIQIKVRAGRVRERVTQRDSVCVCVCVRVLACVRVCLQGLGADPVNKAYVRGGGLWFESSSW